jgi:phosphohistidine phosphatase
MKKLLLIRHAKAEKEGTVKDIDRPLKYIGIQDARFMAERLKENNLVPEILVTSSALRTTTTAEIFADYLKLPDPEINESIYQATQQTLLKVINHLPEGFDFIGLVGHNPGIAFILDDLTGEVREVHTSTTALIEFDTDNWAEITKESGNLTFYSSPKE